MEPSPHSPLEDVFGREPAVLVEIALVKLQAAGIQLIEWRALLYRRMIVPIVVKDFSYVVPDEDLTRASDILSAIGLPISPHSELFTRVAGDIHTKATFHRLTRSVAPAWLQCFVLFPASFASLYPEELSTTPSVHLLPSRSTTNILVPRPSAVYAWLLRTMLKYDRWNPVQVVLASEISELVDYHLLDVQEGFVDPDESPEQYAALNMEKRVADAHEVINQWTEDHEWREGEEGFADALKGMVSGGDIDDYLF